jgi:hypothetical protein
MELVVNIPKLFRFRRHKPRTSKSRWKKAKEKQFQRKHPGAKIIEAHPKSPFMTVQYFPKTEADHKAIQDETMKLLMVAGVGAVGTAALLKALK